MIDFAADTAAVFADPQGFGEDATYTPDGGIPVSVRVVPSQPDEEISFGQQGIAGATTRFWLPVAAVSSPAEGDTIEHAGATYVIQGRPRRDERRVLWLVDTRPQ